MSDHPRLTHLDESGAAHMVDVGEKPVTQRLARAQCLVRMSEPTRMAVRDSTLAKGDALATARIAGIMAAKRTSSLIPLCHPLPIESVEVEFDFQDEGIQITCSARVTARTGIEMEALTGAAVAGLTLIDMVKGIERGVELEYVRLIEKSGGRSGEWHR
ncbi:MAG TPA: cyclic pyranopterin monophosphate synthase MoaC [Candidatus Dormibacteraeota bacterium]|nr:cyclic pyranopterin monophosphate synthase MoaC [Candidatus Dormibacteraeota bacterium]